MNEIINLNVKNASEIYDKYNKEYQEKIVKMSAEFSNAIQMIMDVFSVKMQNMNMEYKDKINNI